MVIVPVANNLVMGCKSVKSVCPWYRPSDMSKYHLICVTYFYVTSLLLPLGYKLDVASALKTTTTYASIPSSIQILQEGDSAEPKAQTTPHPSMTPNSDSIADVLQESHMMNGDIGQRKERTFSRTIWDTPKEREENVPGTQNETTGTLNSTGNEDTAATAQSTL